MLGAILLTTGLLPSGSVRGRRPATGCGFVTQPGSHDLSRDVARALQVPSAARAKDGGHEVSIFRYVVCRIRPFPRYASHYGISANPKPTAAISELEEAMDPSVLG